MSSQRLAPSPSLAARPDQPLIAVPVEHDGEERVCYFVDDAAADRALEQAGTARTVIKLAGIWSDLDAEEMLASLQRMRKESPPSSPITAI